MYLILAQSIAGGVPDPNNSAREIPLVSNQNTVVWRPIERHTYIYIDIDIRYLATTDPERASSWRKSSSPHWALPSCACAQNWLNVTRCANFWHLARKDCRICCTLCSFECVLSRIARAFSNRIGVRPTLAQGLLEYRGGEFSEHLGSRANGVGATGANRPRISCPV